MAGDVQQLLDERAITRVLLDYCRAVDRFDMPLLRSVYHADGRDEHGAFNGSAAEFCNFFERVAGAGSPYEVTQHCLSNVSIDLDGDVAHVESYFTAFHRREDSSGAFDEFVGGRYVDRFERRDGAWRIWYRRTVYDWSRIEPATGRFWEQAQWLGGDRFIKGRRDRGDPVYRRLPAGPANGS